MRRRTSLATTLILLMTCAAAAQQKLLTIDDIYDPVKGVDFGGSPPTGLRWLKDGEHYLEARREGEGGTSQLLKVDAVSGQASPLLDVRKLERAFAALPGLSAQDAVRVSRLTSYKLNPAETAILVNDSDDLFYYEFGSEKALRLTHTPEPELGEEFSPDGRLVSFTRGGNLFVVDITTQKERALTTDGGPKLLNGRLDWVYQEELYGRGSYKGYWWSPDSSRLAFLRLDESPVHEFAIVDHIPHLQDVEMELYPKAGDPNPRVRLGVVSAAGGATSWVDTFNYEGSEPLIVRVDWSGDGARVVYEVQNREQTWLDLNYADPATGKTERILRETSKAWVAVIDNPYWLKDGSFLWLSERSGFQHIYRYSPDGKLIKQVTDGRWEADSIAGVDETGWIYFVASEHSFSAWHAYRVKLDGTGLTRLTQSEGNHAVNFSPTFKHFIDTHSDLRTPREVLICGSGGNIERVAHKPGTALAQYKLGTAEFLKVNTRDGFEMDAIMIKPPDFNPSKKYPVMTYTYSGPHAPQVRNAWWGNVYVWHQMLAERGYIIWICDNRTASGKGIESTWPVYKNFGELELRDLEDGIAWLKSQPYIDGSRIGLWGWSFGGFMTTYALTHSKTFKLGIAGGSVTDWRLYDSIYTERYMSTPQNNPEGYARSAPVGTAKDLSGKLLLIHGMIDDNVHMQNTIQFAYELQQAGKPFQLMLYPKSRHGLTDPLLVKHLMSTMTEFITSNL